MAYPAIKRLLKRISALQTYSNAMKGCSQGGIGKTISVCLEVSAVNAVGEGPEGSFTPPTLSAPAAPVALQQTAATARSAALSWTVADPDGEKVTRCTVRDLEGRELVTVAPTSATRKNAARLKREKY